MQTARAAPDLAAVEQRAADEGERARIVRRDLLERLGAGDEPRVGSGREGWDSPAPRSGVEEARRAVAFFVYASR